MNHIVLCGNVTQNPKLTQAKSPNGENYCRFVLAVDRDYTSVDGVRSVDYFDCVAWGVRAELVVKYARKGSRLTLWGRVDIATYEDNNGEKRRNYSVHVSGIDFYGSKPAVATKEVVPD